MQAYLLVGIGGAIGAMARYGAGVLVGHLWRQPFPLATLLINVVGSLAMGLLVGWFVRVLPPSQNEIRLFVAVGILGGFTTFSSFSLDAIALFERGDFWQAAVYIGVSVVASILALWIGLVMMRTGVAA
ncbi:MAG TPA: fluoride efflux transporter CrcB [Devosia sp.]|nr:fluoride efflux transporter CrcB [Devosia sp.]